MKKKVRTEIEDDLRPEYDLRQLLKRGVRGKYLTAGRLLEGLRPEGHRRRPAVMSDSHAAPWLSEALKYESGHFRTAGQDSAVCETAADYRPRNPVESILYRVVDAELENFIERQRLRDRHVPRFVERELRSFLDCGILARGFLRVHCDACRLDRLVPFSCKGRAYAELMNMRSTATSAEQVTAFFMGLP